MTDVAMETKLAAQLALIELLTVKNEGLLAQLDILHDAVAERDAQQGQLARAQMQIADLAVERDALRQRLDAVTADKQRAQQERNEYHAETERLRARLDAAAAELHTLRFRIEAAEFAAADRVQRRTRRVPDCEHGCDLDTFGTHQDDCPIDAARIVRTSSEQSL